jgi:hypothetical protein
MRKGKLARFQPVEVRPRVRGGARFAAQHELLGHSRSGSSTDGLAAWKSHWQHLVKRTQRYAAEDTDRGRPPGGPRFAAGDACTLAASIREAEA